MTAEGDTTNVAVLQDGSRRLSVILEVLFEVLSPSQGFVECSFDLPVTEDLRQLAGRRFLF